MSVYMMRRLNHAGIAFLLTVAFLFTGCLKNPERDKQKYLKSGIQYLEKGKREAAILQFQNALKLDPRYVDAFYQLSQAYLGVHDYRNAHAVLQQAVELDPNRIDVRLNLGQVYLAAREFEKVGQEASFVLKKDPKNVTAYQLLAMSSMMRRQREPALQAFEKVVELRPQDPASYINMALVEIGSGKMQQAEAHLQKAVETGPRFPQAYISLANYYRLTRQLPRAEQALEQGLGNNPDDASLYLTLADFLYAQQKADAGEAIIARLRTRSPKSASVAIQIGEFYSQRNLADKAIAEYRRGLEIDRKNAELTSRLVEAYLSSGRTKEAETLNAEVLNERPKDIAAGIAHARILMAAGKKDDAITELRRITSQAQDSMEAHYFLALAYWQNQQLAQAKTELVETRRIAPDSVLVERSLTQLHMELGEMQPAQEIAEAMVQKRSTSAPDRLLLGMVYLRQGATAKARAEFTTARQLAPADANASLDIAQTYAVERKWAEAQKEFENALTLNPRLIQALEGLANVHVKKGAPGEATARVGQFVAKYPDDAQGHLLLGTLQLAQKNYPAAKSEFQRSIQLDPKLLMAHLHLASTQQAQGDIAGAIQAYEQALALQPKAAALHTIVGGLYERQKNDQMAQKHYERAIAIDPNYALAANNLAWMYARDGGNLDVALGLAQKAKELQPDLVNATDTLGWIQYKKGLYVAAVPLFQDCVAKAPGSAVYQYHLGLALMASGDKEKGKVHLQSALRMKLDGDDADRARQALSSAN